MTQSPNLNYNAKIKNNADKANKQIIQTARLTNSSNTTGFNYSVNFSPVHDNKNNSTNDG